MPTAVPRARACSVRVVRRCVARLASLLVPTAVPRARACSVRVVRSFLWFWDDIATDTNAYLDRLRKRHGFFSP